MDSSKVKESTRRFVWSKYPKKGFPGRVNHATTVARNVTDGKLYLFSIGGFHDEEEKQYMFDDPPGFSTGPIDILRMDIATCEWVQVDAVCETKNKDVPIREGKPPRRYGHTCVSYGDKIFMYGGRNDDDGAFRVMECFDVTHSMWLKIHATPEGCELPKSRDGHACTSNGKTMFMHGGFNTWTNKFVGDLYSFDMETYTWMLLPQNDTLYRDFHTLTYIDGKIVLFGGRSDNFAPDFSNQDIYDDSFHEYLLDEKKWVKATPSGYQPQGRRSHCAVRYSDDKILYFAGFNAIDKLHFNDVFIYDSRTQHVIEVQPFGIPPTPRRRCGYCIVNNEVIFHGGTSPVEKKIHGVNQFVLHNHAETVILSLLPTLQQLAMMAVKEFQLSTGILPVHIRQQLQQF